MKEKLVLLALCLPLALMCACSDDKDDITPSKVYSDGWGYYAPEKHLTSIKSVTYDTNDEVVNTQGKDLDCTFTWDGNHVKTFTTKDNTYTYTYEGDRITRVKSASLDCVLSYGKNGLLMSYDNTVISYDIARVRPNKMVTGSEASSLTWSGSDLVQINTNGNLVDITYEDHLNNPFWNFVPMNLSNALSFYSKHCYKQYVYDSKGNYLDYQYEVTDDGYPCKITLRKLGKDSTGGKTVFTLTYEDDEAPQ